jgi:hypothetical protein
MAGRGQPSSVDCVFLAFVDALPTVAARRGGHHADGKRSRARRAPAPSARSTRRVAGSTWSLRSTLGASNRFRRGMCINIRFPASVTAARRLGNRYRRRCKARLTT